MDSSWSSQLVSVWEWSYASLENFESDRKLEVDHLVKYMQVNIGINFGLRRIIPGRENIFQISWNDWIYLRQLFRRVILTDLLWTIYFSGTNVHTGEEVAIKLEPLKSKHPQLLYESKIYRVLQGGCKSAYSFTWLLDYPFPSWADGIPSVKWFGSEGDYNVLGDYISKDSHSIFYWDITTFSYWFAGSVAGRSIQLLWQEILSQDCADVGRPDASSPRIHALQVPTYFSDEVLLFTVPLLLRQVLHPQRC